MMELPPVCASLARLLVCSSALDVDGNPHLLPGPMAGGRPDLPEEVTNFLLSDKFSGMLLEVSRATFFVYCDSYS